MRKSVALVLVVLVVLAAISALLAGSIGASRSAQNQKHSWQKHRRLNFRELSRLERSRRGHRLGERHGWNRHSHSRRRRHLVRSHRRRRRKPRLPRNPRIDANNSRNHEFWQCRRRAGAHLSHDRRRRNLENGVRAEDARDFLRCDRVLGWRHGIVVSDPVGGRFAFFTTDDGGVTWTQIPPASLPAALPNEGAFAASNSCLTVEGTNNVWFVNRRGQCRARFSFERSRQIVAGGGRRRCIRRTRVRVCFRSRFTTQRTDCRRRRLRASGSSPGPVVFLTSDGGVTWRAGAPADPPGLFLSSVTYKPRARGEKSSGGEIVAAGTAGIVSMVSDNCGARERAECKRGRVRRLTTEAGPWARRASCFIEFNEVEWPLRLRLVDFQFVPAAAFFVRFARELTPTSSPSVTSDVV